MKSDVDLAEEMEAEVLKERRAEFKAALRSVYVRLQDANQTQKKLQAEYDEMKEAGFNAWNAERPFRD